MTGILIGILYVVLVITCLFLGLLILVQLPKKDAGAGMAFGGGAGEALFGAGSGNVLTKLTKYAATAFLVMALLLSVIVSKASKNESSAIDEGLAAESGTSSATAPSAPGTQTMPLEDSETISLPQLETETDPSTSELQLETEEPVETSGEAASETTEPQETEVP